jgi:hypothetical protein
VEARSGHISIPKEKLGRSRKVYMSMAERVNLARHVGRQLRKQLLADEVRTIAQFAKTKKDNNIG